MIINKTEIASLFRAELLSSTSSSACSEVPASVQWREQRLQRSHIVPLYASLSGRPSSRLVGSLDLTKTCPGHPEIKRKKSYYKDVFLCIKGSATNSTLMYIYLAIHFSSVTVTGPQFHKVHVGVGHRLDAFSSGVLGDRQLKP